LTEASRVGGGVLLGLILCLPLQVMAQTSARDDDETAYAPATLAKVLGGTARSQNDEAELAPAGAWYFTTATFTGQKRPPSGRLRPLLSSWLGSRGEPAEMVDLYFGGDLPELQFEQAGKKYWVLAGLPGGLGFEVYPAGQKLSIYLQRIGFASGTPVAMLRMVKLPDGVPVSAASSRSPRMGRLGEGARRQEGTFRTGSATFTYAGRQYTLPLDVSGRHSVPPGLYRYENGVRTALLEYGADDRQYLLLRVTVPEGAESPHVVPYLVLAGRIVPPIDLGPCEADIARVDRTGTNGSLDCAAVPRSVLGNLSFSAR
jgi:hypothetical protein